MLLLARYARCAAKITESLRALSPRFRRIIVKYSARLSRRNIRTVHTASDWLTVNLGAVFTFILGYLKDSNAAAQSFDSGIFYAVIYLSARFKIYSNLYFSK